MALSSARFSLEFKGPPGSQLAIYDAETWNDEENRQAGKSYLELLNYSMREFGPEYLVEPGTYGTQQNLGFLAAEDDEALFFVCKPPGTSWLSIKSMKAGPVQATQFNKSVVKVEVQAEDVFLSMSGPHPRDEQFRNLSTRDYILSDNPFPVYPLRINWLDPEAEWLKGEPTMQRVIRDALRVESQRVKTIEQKGPEHRLCLFTV